MNIQLIERNLNFDEYQSLRHAVGWRETDPIMTEQSLNQSLYSVTALSGKKTVGMGRVVGDDGLYFYIQDLIIHPDYQKQGLGKKIMCMLMGYIQQQAKTGSFIGLMATPGLEDFYQTYGFKTGNEGGKGMFQFIE